MPDAAFRHRGPGGACPPRAGTAGARRSAPVPCPGRPAAAGRPVGGRPARRPGRIPAGRVAATAQQPPAPWSVHDPRTVD
ncbi:hypothetical protein ISF6_1097 [Piscinibacter sakaiensis]|uniref:Uncharacterized protein n=1 Tax=Piscinibacter sakaiensis TaxID=1547922 RepID=A0A0K8NTX9_PISS1|nr:hypothetical protein ISF6_1097 [Piscinibacter sakaiensis]